MSRRSPANGFTTMPDVCASVIQPAPHSAHHQTTGHLSTQFPTDDTDRVVASSQRNPYPSPKTQHALVLPFFWFVIARQPFWQGGLVTRRSVSAASRLFRDAEAESIRCGARSERGQMVVLCMQRRSEPLNGSQLGFGPLAQLGQLSMGGEAPDLSEDLLSDGEVG